LREFLADELGAVINASDANVLNLAANADPVTLSKLARAIRRYSTSRAQQAWVERPARLADFVLRRGEPAPASILCLKCACIEFGEPGAASHQSGGCVSLGLTSACLPAIGPTGAVTEAQVADAIRTLIEEFRRLRAAFGLPHFDLDSYVRNGRITFTWRPLA
jgi:hypothetical protein